MAAPSLFVKDGQIYRARVSPARAATEMDRGEKPFITAVGRAERAEVVARRPQDRVRQHAHRSQLHHGLRRRDPDGAPTSSPSVDFDTSPLWTRDSKSVVFVRRPGAAVRTAGAAGRRRNRRSERTRIPDRTRAGARPPDAAGEGRRSQTPRRRGAADRRRAARREHARPDAGHVQGRLHAVGLERRCRDGRGGRGLAQPAERSHVHELREPPAGGRPPDRAVQRRRRRARRPRTRRAVAGGTAGGPGRRMGTLLLDRPLDAEREAGAADDDRRPHRGSDVGRALGGRQDALLLHQREGHRAAPHLGGAGRRRHAAAGDERRGHRDVSRTARVRQDARDPERRLEDAAVGRHLAARRPPQRQRRRSSSRRPTSTFRWTRT